MTISALFFFLALAFFLLAGGVKDENVDRAGGWAGMIAAGLAFWLASLEIINDVVGGKRSCPFGSSRCIALEVVCFLAQ